MQAINVLPLSLMQRTNTEEQGLSLSTWTDKQSTFGVEGGEDDGRCNKNNTTDNRPEHATTAHHKPQNQIEVAFHRPALPTSARCRRFCVPPPPRQREPFCKQQKIQSPFSKKRVIRETVYYAYVLNKQ